MDLGLSARVALVLGATGGLGSAIARELAAEGALVAVGGRDADRVAATVGTILAGGGRAVPAVWDIRDLDAGRAVVAEIEARHGPLDILVLNSPGPRPGTAGDLDAAQLRDAFDSLVVPLIALGSRVGAGMAERGWGRILLCLSSGVVAPIENLATSNSLRPALVGWAKTLAGELADRGVTVNGLIPGRIATARVAQLDDARADREDLSVAEVRAASLRQIPAGRYGEPEEFAAAAAFLASARASYITGTNLRIDGGMIASVAC